MKSVGEVMAIGRTQQESLQKALRGLEVGATGFDPKVSLDDPEALTKIRRELKDAGADRIWYIADASAQASPVDGVFNLTNIDRWFLVQIEELVRLEEKVAESRDYRPQRRLPASAQAQRFCRCASGETGGRTRSGNP
ncbi:carbamoyl-phosphate synthase large chain [Salmonella enterica subsp. enterica]|uniref:Carbamoyl-phosphate synthase large chain n=1 Tax=Salmonella enterica I TaxID=59201 RepID=A0A379X157_SALET|nr:carbamoyl-phosphate synthase large chain [Salmonella enterica subsp. enterica]